MLKPKAGSLLLRRSLLAVSLSALIAIPVGGSASGALSLVMSSATAGDQTSAEPRMGSYRVRFGDTLWGISERMRPEDVSVQQMMLGFLEANPQAFATGNINSLYSEVLLQLPAREQLQQWTVEEARVEALRQDSAWQSMWGTTPLVGTDVPIEEVGLRILAAEANDGAVDRLSAELAQVREANESRRLEADAMRERMSDFEQLLRRQSDQLAATQQQLAELQEELGRVSSVQQQLAEMREELSRLSTAPRSLTELPEGRVAPSPALTQPEAERIGFDSPYFWLISLGIVLALLIWWASRMPYRSAPMAPPRPLPPEDEDEDDGVGLSLEEQLNTLLNLARALIDMQEWDRARSTLEMVMSQGSEAQQREAQELMQRLP